MDKEKISQFLKSFITWFLVFYVVMWGYNYFFAKKEVPQVAPDKTISIKAVRDKVVLGNLLNLTIENQDPAKISFESPCEAENSTLKFYKLVNGKRFEIEDFSDCGDRKVAEFILENNQKTNFTIPDFSADIFKEEGEYFAEFTFDKNGEPVVVESEPFFYSEPGTFRQLFRSLITKPLFNLLVFFTQHLPNKSLGWGIVLLTVLVRLLLFIPNQKAMKSQRNMQKLQPKLEEVKKKFAGDQQKIAMKTMELYKTHKISPVSSCLPMLFQIPIMLGVYYIVRDGLSPHMAHLLYSFQQNVVITNVDSLFLGIDLLKKNIYVLPAVVGIAQWIAIKLSFISKKKKSGGKSAKKEGMGGQMEQMNVVMQWGMPLMIAFFTRSFPAAVGIYWLTSTLFGIAQQKYVNWKLDQPQVVRKIS
jgi:YidC/Oxa1 family membrane protein insertase